MVDQMEYKEVYWSDMRVRYPNIGPIVCSQVICDSKIHREVGVIELERLRAHNCQVCGQ
jgi:hypothetical protein